jgi:DNA-binding CsgD family transcriptional regulator
METTPGWGERLEVEIARALSVKELEQDAPQPCTAVETHGSVAASFGRLLLELYPLALTASIGDFEVQLFSLLREHLDFDSAWLGRSTLIDGTPLMHSNALYRLNPSFLSNWEDIKYQDPLVPLVKASPGRAVRMLVTDERMCPEFRRFTEKHNMAQLLCVISVDPALNLWTHLSLYRNSLVPRFAEKDIELAELVMPHIASVLNINRVQYLERVMHRTSNQRVSAAICDGAGVMLYADASFADLVLLEWPDWKGGRLPSPLLPALLANERGAFVGAHLSLQAEKLGDMRLVQIRPRSAIDVLTPKELSVARLFGEGLTYKAVARRLGLSPATVRHHLRQTYSKLHIQNKGEIAWLLTHADEAAAL